MRQNTPPQSVFNSDSSAELDSFSGRSILVTGAGGTIGSELCKKLLLADPKRLILLDHCEHALYSVLQNLSAVKSKVHIIPTLGSVTDTPLVNALLRSQLVTDIFHAAAYKHVPLVEANPIAGFYNNVFGTYTVARAAHICGVKKIVLVSTDKAVSPTSTMGLTKWLAEQVVQTLAQRGSKTQYATVRLGNVYGSSGSVVPLFWRQVQNGGPITLSHPDATRYFMSVAEAVRLITVAGTLARNFDLFHCDMGTPRRILDVALDVISQAGLHPRDAKNPKGDIDIQICGLRPGEKLHEANLLDAQTLPTTDPKIRRAIAATPPVIDMELVIDDIVHAHQTHKTDRLTALMNRYKPRDHLEEQISGKRGHGPARAQ